MEVLVLDGKNYVKASKAARDLGYAPDYVGQLCRSGQVDAHLIGRTWYVNQSQLGTHRVEKKRMSRVKAREQAKKMIEEHRNLKVKTLNNHRNIDISYEADTESLIPEVKKLSIISEATANKSTRIVDDFKGENFTLSNKGEKVVLSGDLTVVDVTDGENDLYTTVLTPRILTQQEEKVTIEKQKQPAIAVTAKTAPIKKFTDRLEELEVSQTNIDQRYISENANPVALPIQSGEDHNLGSNKVQKTQNSIFTSAVVVLVFLLGGLSTIPISHFVIYNTESDTITSSYYSFSISKATKLLQQEFNYRFDEIPFK